MLHIPDPHSKAYVYATSWWNADTVDQYLRCGVLLACCCQVGRASITGARRSCELPASSLLHHPQLCCSLAASEHPACEHGM